MKSHWWSFLFHNRLLSPKGLVLRAAVLTGLFLAVHIAGLREYTVVLSGTSPTGIRADVWAGTLGLVYVFFYFAFVIGVPILLLGAAFFMIFQRLAPHNTPARATHEPTDRSNLPNMDRRLRARLP